MFYQLSQFLSSEKFLNLFKYITFRSFLAFLISLVVSIFFGATFIRWIQKKQFGQIIRDDGPQAHLKKAGTPTMGGVFIFISFLIASFLCGNLTGGFFWASIAIATSYFSLGLLDDWLKISKKKYKRCVW